MRTHPTPSALARSRLSPWAVPAACAALVWVSACGGGDPDAAAAAGADVDVKSPAVVAAAVEQATADGWASQSGGTTGGAAAVAADIYTVTSRSQFLAAIAAGKNRPKIIRVQGTIDMTEGVPYTSHDDQKTRGELKLKANTTVIGLGSDAQLINGWIMVRKIDNVIVRHLKIVNPCDVAPEWDSGDGPTGNWNSEWDGLTIDGATHVWIDHLTFTDGDLTDDKLPIEKGHVKQCHDGALDIKNASDYVTVSNTVFEQHQKNSLIGQSDTNDKDEGHQTITFHHNLFRNIGQRAPRVRYAMLHSYNNLFVGSKSHPVYPHLYSLGAGYAAKIISQNNVFNITGAAQCADVIANPNSASAAGAVAESGSLLNGAALVASQCGLSTAVNWTVPYLFTLQSAAEGAASVTAHAGAGKL